MQLVKRQNHITSNGNIGTQTKFGIAITGKMFRVLSDSMYQDKIGSIVREISCNAKDAHTEAGTPNLPITIHVPNAVEPWFSVKDFGTGMSDRDIRELYAIYGESTRDQTNDTTGCYGLGSKTPFSYSDQFTIISTFDGMQRTYVAAFDDDEPPVLNLQDERESSEHAGLEIHMAVKNDDFGSFRSAITKQLRFFKVKPTLENNMTSIEFTDMYDEELVTYRNDDLVIYKGGWGNPVSSLYVVQGEVGYPVDIDLLDGITDEVRDFAEAINEKGAWFEVPIGAIGVTSSRESISYKPETITSIISELHRISISICKNAIDDINAEPLRWEKCVIFNSQIDVMQNAIVSSVGDLSKLITGAVRSGRAQNMALKFDKLKLAGLKVVKFGKHEYRTRGGGYYSNSTKWRLSRTELTSPSIDNNSRHGGGTFLYPANDLNVFIRDTNSKPVARMKLYVEENEFPTLLVIENFFGGSTETTIKHAALALGISESNISKMSDMETPAVNRNGTPAGKRARGYQYDCGDIFNSKGWTPVMDLDDLGTAVYVGMERHSINLDDDARQMMVMKRDGNLNYPVVAVNQQTFARIKKGKVGTDLITPTEALEPIRENVKSLIPAYKHYLALDRFCDVVERSSTLNCMKRAQNRSQVVSSDIFVKVKKLRKRATEVEATFTDHLYYIRSVGDVSVSEATHKAQKAADKLATKVDAQYPMLQHVNSWDDKSVQDVIDYINLVDNA